MSRILYMNVICNVCFYFLNKGIQKSQIVLISPSDLLVRFCIEKIKEMNEWKAFQGFVFGFPK